MPSPPRSSTRPRKPPVRFPSTPQSKMDKSQQQQQVQQQQQQRQQQQQQSQQQQRPQQQPAQQQPVQQQPAQQQPAQQQPAQQQPAQQQPAQEQPAQPQPQNVQQHLQQGQLLTALVAQIQALKESVDQLRDDTSANQTETQRLREAIDYQGGQNLDITEVNAGVATHSVATLPIATSSTVQPHKKLYDLPSFNGKPDEWPLFLANFQETTANFGYSAMENTIRLQRCLHGEAKEAVAALLIHPSNVTQVINTLAFRFGRPDLLVKAQLIKVQQFPAVSENRIEGLIPFATMVENVVAFLLAAKCDHHLSNPMLLEELIMKLPPSRRFEWAKRALEIKPYPTIKEFSTWLSEQAQIIQMLPQLNAPISIRSQAPHPRRIMHTNERDTTPREVRAICLGCGANHQLSECSVFRSLSVKDRWKLVKDKRLCFSCTKAGHGTSSCRIKKRCNVGGCPKFHHKLLHENSTSTVHQQPPEADPPTVQPSVRMHTCQAQVTDGQLFRILPVTITGPRGNINTYAMFDEGSSISIVEEAVANKLGLKGQTQPLTLQWYGTKVVTELSRRVAFEVKGVGQSEPSFYLKNVRTVKDLSLPIQSLVKNDFEHLRNVPVQDLNNAKPTLMIGLDNCHLGIASDVIEGKINEPIAAHTKLGWLAYGPLCAKPNINPMVLCIREVGALEKLNDMVESYFTTENFGVRKPEKILESNDDARARKTLEETTKRIGQQYESGLLWRDDKLYIPDSYQMSLRRLFNIEAKMKRDAEFSMRYTKQMANYIEMGYARELSPKDLKQNYSRIWYLPHFGVINPHKPDKLRIVFDAAAESQGVSLNSMLLKGPEQAQPLLTVLFKFRQGTIGVVADIKEMFSQIKIRSDDQNAQRFLWRGEEWQPIRTYIMSSMIFGAVCSPCTAEYIKNKNAILFEESSPEAAKVVVNNHYVDDLVCSFRSQAEAEVVCEEVKRIHAEGGFTLRKFVSNNKEVQVKLNKISCRSHSAVELESKDAGEKVLGMYWNTEDDTFRFRLTFHRINADILELLSPPTKREMLGIIMAVFDPYGFLANFLIYSKILLQQTWNIGMNWDDPLPSEIFSRWKLWWRELKNISEFQLPRCYSPKIPHADDIELHIFTDASESAFAAVGYFRVQYQGQVNIAFISGKTRCAPKKILSIPRLELQAAVLGSRLHTLIRENHNIEISRVVFWSDSKTTIWWIKSSQRRYKPFVAHRIAEILESSEPTDWRWLPTDLNVADDATRATKPPKFSNNSRWLIGPEFLRLPEQQWPKSLEPNAPETLQEEVQSKMLHIQKASNIIDITKFSSFNRLRRTVAYLLRSKTWLNRARVNIAARKKANAVVESTKRFPSKDTMVSSLKANEVLEADKFLYKLAQKDDLYDEIQCLKKGLPIPRNSGIFQLTPYLDENGLVRLNGRLNFANCVPADARCPIILPKHHYLSQLIVDHYHVSLHHQNDALTINEIRQRFWVPQIRSTLKKVKKNCQRCKLNRAKPATPLMGQLPPDRVTPFVRPFTYTGLDYFGPLNVAVGRRREKRWVALFTCLTTRAIHLELAADLSTDSFILCLRNFINRRGIPVRIRSDNGTNFIGAQRELVKEAQFFDFESIQNEMTKKGIEWKFNCPLNPSEGGIWERMVQSVKKILKVTLKQEAPRVETLRSLLIEAENIINSRPLTELPISSIEDEPLTPNHFLIGCTNSTQTPNLDDSPICSRKQWKIAQQLKDRFWKRWILEYLPFLTKRSKWHDKSKPLKVDDLVVICDASQPRSKWQRGRITKVYPAKDEQIRSADVKTTSGILRRPASKLAVLEVNGESP